jgi:hypothetical protein
MPICHAKQTSSALGLPNFVNFLSELHALKVDLFLKTQGIGTTSPSGKAMFGMRRSLPISSAVSFRNESAPAPAGSGGF